MKIGTTRRITAASATRRATANLKRPYERFTYTRAHDGGMVMTDTISGASWSFEPHEYYPQVVDGTVDKKEK